jgi:hypothetical protein
MIMQPKYPDITIQLSGDDGNAFAILGKCHRAIRKAGLPREEWLAFEDEATSDDYNHLLATAMLWFDCD